MKVSTNILQAVRKLSDRKIGFVRRYYLVAWISILASMVVGINETQAQTLKNGGVYFNTGTSSFKEVQNYSGSTGGTIRNAGTINITVTGGSGDLINDKNGAGTVLGTVLNYIGGTGTGTIVCGASTGNYTNGAGITRNDSLNNYAGTIKTQGALTSSGTFDTDTGTVEYNGTVAQTVLSGVVTNKYGNLIITGASTKTLGGSITVGANLTINTGATLYASATNYNITLGGTWTNNGGTFNAGSGTATVTLNGAAAQTIGGTSSTSFNNLTLSNASGVTLNIGTTVNGGLSISSGTLSDGGFQITGNATGSMSMAAGTGLTLGTAGTGTAFPSNFINTNITLNTTSTVTYNSNQAQSVSIVPTYGELIFSGTGMKTFITAGTATVTGDMTINSNVPVTVNNGVTIQVNGDVNTIGVLTNNGIINIGN